MKDLCVSSNQPHPDWNRLRTAGAQGWKSLVVEWPRDGTMGRRAPGPWLGGARSLVASDSPNPVTPRRAEQGVAAQVLRTQRNKGAQNTRPRWGAAEGCRENVGPRDDIQDASGVFLT